MREGGLEPPRPYGHRNLNPARLPIPPLARERVSVPARAAPRPLPGTTPLASIRWDSSGSSAGSNGSSRAPSEGIPQRLAARRDRSAHRPRHGRRPHARRARHRRARTASPCDCRSEDLERFAGFHDALVQRAGRRRARPRARGGATTSKVRSKSRSCSATVPAGVTSWSRAEIVGGAMPATGHARPSRRPQHRARRRNVGHRPNARMRSVRSPIRRSRATTPRSAATRTASTSSTSARPTARSVNGVVVKERLLKDGDVINSRRNVDPLRGVVAGHVRLRPHGLEVLPLALLYLFLVRVVWIVRARTARNSRAAAVSRRRRSTRRSRTRPGGESGGWSSSNPRPNAVSRSPSTATRRSVAAAAATCRCRSTPSRLKCTRAAHDRDGNLWIEDAGSTNGTIVNGAKIDHPTKLRKGDRVKIGETLLEVDR